MTDAPSHRPATARIHAGVPELLSRRGFAPEAIEALLAFDLAMFDWRRMSEKGEFKGKVLADIDHALEPAMIQGLLAVGQIASGLGQPAQPPTIGLVAERLAVDPSRASRIVSELVARGYLERELDQADARKTYLVLTARAKDFFGQFSRAKWEIMATVFAGWSGEDIAMFSRLFARYAAAMAEVLRGEPD